jgi:hypothetical protein
MENDKSKLIEGVIADYRLDDAGILYSYSKPILRTVQNIKENVALVQSITSNKPVHLLIFLCDSPVPDKATREYSKTQLPLIYKAMAMVSKPGLSSFIMKLLFRLQKPPIPMRSFTDEGKAREWIQQFVEGS